MTANRTSTQGEDVPGTINQQNGDVYGDDDIGKPVCVATAVLPKQAGDEQSMKQPVRRIKQLTGATIRSTDDEDVFFGPPPAGRVTVDEASDEGAASVLSEVNRITTQGRRFPWSSWSKHRERWTVLGCLSSVAVLTIRLVLDWEPTAYRIHSWVVFFDMVLIHCFTSSVWLSVTGESMTILCFLLFHYTKETVFELTETTVIAVLCSLHMIRSRSKALVKLTHLEEIVEEMSSRQEESSSSLIQQTPPDHGLVLEKTDDAAVKDIQVQYMEEGVSNTRRFHQFKARSKRCGQHFFEHFLDGSAGVMYTSFVGLIISEMINYGSRSCK